MVIIVIVKSQGNQYIIFDIIMMTITIGIRFISCVGNIKATLIEKLQLHLVKMITFLQDFCLISREITTYLF